MKKIALFFLVIAVAATSLACAKSNTGSDIKQSATRDDWQQFANKDFSFTYPATWKADIKGGTLDRFKAKGIIAVNSFKKEGFWIKPIDRKELSIGGGGLFAKRLPESGIYMFIMKVGESKGKSAKAASDLKATTTPFGTAEKFEALTLKLKRGFTKLSEERQERLNKKWAPPKGQWQHYRVQIVNHGKQYSAHIYVMGNAQSKEKYTVEKIIKSFRLVK